MPHVDHLRCEYLENPLGVDTREPRLSWRMIDPQQQRGRRQSAYHVVVEQVQGETVTTLWDSGKVTSDRSVNVVYGGSPLRSAMDCRWRVRVWDEHDQATAWSGEARFVMGLLERWDWQASWIRCDTIEQHQHAWYRRAMTLDAVADSAVMFVASVGYHELYVNGRRMGDAVLSPGVTNLAKRGLYMSYDVTDALRAGENVIGMWVGPGWARADGSYGKGVWDQTMMVMAQLMLDGAVGLVSDQRWRCALSSSENIGLWNGGGQGTYGGERIDARRHLPDWNQADFDDRDWPAAVTATQSIEISSALFEPDRQVETLMPVSMTEQDGEFIFDMGRNFTGWFEIDLRGGEAGQVVHILTANREGERCEYDQDSEYIFDESGQGTFCHRFNWMAGRWVTVTGLNERPCEADVRGYVVTNDRRRIGHFACSDEQLTAIYETDLNTYISNTVNAVVMDCPHRERYGYGEVALACTWGCGIPNYESAAFYKKVTRDWMDVQDEDGMVNTIAPQPYKGAGGTLWSSAGLTSTWEFWRAYGDERQLRQAYPHLSRWMQYLADAVTADGVLMPYTIDSRFLGDWATPHGNEYGNTPQAQLFNNGVYAYNLMVMIEIAQALGHDEDAVLYQERLDALRQAAHKFFYNTETGLYVEGLQQSLLFPLYTRITPEPLRSHVFAMFMRDLTEKGYLDTGSPGLPIMQKWVVEDRGEPEILLPALQRKTFPSYGYFLERGETAWPEYWEIDGIQSRIHTCFTSIAGYFVKGIGGIQADPHTPGMKRCVIRPGIIGDLTWADTTTESLYGPITCNWKRDADQVTVEIEIPPNSSAAVYLKNLDVATLTEAGYRIDEAEDIHGVANDHQITLELEAGHYRFAFTTAVTT